MNYDPNDSELPPEIREQVRQQVEQMAMQQASEAALAALKGKMIEQGESMLHAAINTLRDISPSESGFCMAIAAVDRLIKAKLQHLSKDDLRSDVKAVILDLFAELCAREAAYLREGQKAHDDAMARLLGSRTMKEGA